jgi:hypothetical protein
MKLSLLSFEQNRKSKRWKKNPSCVGEVYMYRPKYLNCARVPNKHRYSVVFITFTTTFFSPNATTCPLWTSGSPLPVVAEVKPTSEVGTPMRRIYVVPMRWMVIYEYEVSGGALNLNSTKLPRPWSPWGSSPSRKNPHGRTGNRIRDLTISSQKL